MGSINCVSADGDVTRHAEVVAISAAQPALGTISLDDYTIYVKRRALRLLLLGMAAESEDSIKAWSPLAARVLERRALFRAPRDTTVVTRGRDGLARRLMAALPRSLFDHFGRR